MKRIAGIVGLILFVVGVITGVVLLRSQQRAKTLDRTETGFGIVTGDVPPCAWDVSVQNRVVTENHSQAIVVNATNTMDVACQSTVSLLAPGFNVTPHKDEQVVKAQANGKGSVAWIATANDAGDYELVVTDGINTSVVGITVTNLLGLTALQAQIFAMVGSIFGPMLSIPWWFERWQQRKKARPQAPAGIAS